MRLRIFTVIGIFLVIALFIFSSNAFAVKNPAAIYCIEMGYTYDIEMTEKGERGICIVEEGLKFDAWDFLKGKVGTEYSYCAMNGYDLEVYDDGMNPYSIEYAVCVSKLDGSRTSMHELMNLNDKLATNLEPSSNEELLEDEKNTLDPIEDIELPSHFDWRDFNGHNWLTPVKSQSYCGSCWAFAAVGGVEAKIKIARNDPHFNVDLAEQDLVSCSWAGSCSGGHTGDALWWIEHRGIVDEPCFLYKHSDVSCSGRCTEYDRRLWFIDDWGWIGNNEEYIKKYLLTKGPLPTYMKMWGYFDPSGIYRCDWSAIYGHAVVITGYDDNGGYWIAKNSAGIGFGDGGYFKIGYGECEIHMQSSPFFIDLDPRPVEKINVSQVDAHIGDVIGDKSGLEEQDWNWIIFKEDCNEENCQGMDIRADFKLDSLPLESDDSDEGNPSSYGVSSMDIIAFHRSMTNKDNIAFHFWDNTDWESLGRPPHLGWYLVKYNLCNTSWGCRDYLLLNEEVQSRYYSPSSASSSQGFALADCLYLEASLNKKSPPDQVELENDFEVKQWANSATASSEYDHPDWGAIQATGPPDTFQCGDFSTAWAPLTDGSDPEYLEVLFEKPVQATGINIHETHIGSFVFQVDLIDNDNAYHTIWSGVDTTPCGTVFALEWELTDYQVKGARIHTCIDGWEEIDAVQLIGKEW